MKFPPFKLAPVRFRSPRLLPIVIFAALSLLVFKGVGIISNGGYVLTGVGAAVASSADPAATPPADGAASDAPASGGDASAGSEPTMTDSSPTLADGAPTAAAPLPDKPAAAAPAGGGATAAAASAHGDAVATPPAALPGKPTSFADSLSCPPDATGAPAPMAAAATPAPAAAHGAAAAPAIPAPAAASTDCGGDAVAMKIDASGKKVPFGSADGASPTQDVLLQRLAARRAELDKRDAELTLRESIVQAAEKQMQDRADALKALEAQITALSDQKKSMEDEAFQGVVKMYEAMKPTDAATIFNGLDMGVLERVAKAMDPRKMSPVLAKMSAQRAQELTTTLAAEDPTTSTVASADASPGALPQIVGH